MKQLITICCVAIGVLLSGSVLAVDVSKPSPNETARDGRSASHFLTPDGRFDLNAVHTSGYQGPLDRKGVEVRVDPRSGVPTVSAASPQSPADDPDDVYWDNSISPSIPGVDGAVYAMTVYDGKLIVGGSFTAAGTVMVNNIAAWDGSEWSPLGCGIDSIVLALTVYDGELIAGGSFRTAGGEEANEIASWNGSSWSPLGIGMDSGVSAVTVYDGQLIAGGRFTSAGGVTANCVASWDGNRWVPLGLGFNGRVSALAIYDRKLIAGGLFTTAGGDSANCIAEWDGIGWSSLGSLVIAWSGYADCGIGSLAVFENRLIAGRVLEYWGWYTTLLVSWDGSGWHGVGGPQSGAWAISVYQGHLIGGYQSVYVWEDSSSHWSIVGNFPTYCGLSPDPPSPPQYFATSFATFDNVLIVGGKFSSVNGTVALSIAAWDNTNWSALALKQGCNISAIATCGNHLVAAGFLSNCETSPRVWAYNGSNWLLLDSAMHVNALAVYDSKLIAGGSFDTTGGVAAHDIASWDGSSWSPLGSGIEGYYGVYALTVYDGKLVAGGNFTTAGGVAAKYIASWDGTSWSALGQGMGYGYVHALTVYDGKLIAGGNFRTAGGMEANRVASWDGSNWSPLGLGMDYNVYALTVYDGRLIAGGDFSTAGGDSASAIASWDGNNWSTLGLGLKGTVPASWPVVTVLRAYDGKVIAGGRFTKAGSNSADNIASWDGISWSQMGSGLNRTFEYNEGYAYVSALEVFNEDLVVGGSFYNAGEKAAAFVARWTRHDPTDNDEHDRTALPDALNLVQNYPNPFNPATTIEYNVPTRAHVTIEIYNVLGQHLTTLVDETKSAGKYKTEWNGTDGAGRAVSTGVYLYRFRAGDFVETKKMLLIK